MTQTPFQKFLESKGISEQTAELWGWEDHGTEAHFRYPEGVKIRTGIGTEDRGFKFSGKLSLYYRDPRFKPTVFICEGESDAAKLDEELRNNGFGEKVSVVAVPGINTWKPEYAKKFEGVERIRVVLDNDSDYKVRATVDKAFEKIRDDLGRQRVRRIYLPDREGDMDVCSFFQNYSFKSFLEIAKPSNTTNYTKLDLNAEPPPAEWLLEGLICKGDVALVAATPGIGKSLFAQLLSVAVASGSERFLGKLLHGSGPVMYLDKENPQDVIYERLNPPGMTPEARERLHYYYRPDIYLDRAPEKLLDDAQIIKPALIVLDSLVGFHQQNENEAGSMRRLFIEGIVPLARETGAAVVVIHHSGKGGDSSYQRIRGSGDIQAAADNVIELTKSRAVDDNGTERESIKLVQDKTRRASRGGGIEYFIDVNPAGDVELNRVKDGF